jgi:hypothetical protein
MSQFECSVADLNNDNNNNKKISRIYENENENENENVNVNVKNTRETSEENNLSRPSGQNNVIISFLDKLKDEINIKTILLIIIGYVLTTSSLFKDIVEIWIPNIVVENEISLIGKVIIAALIGVITVWFTSFSQVH